MAGTAGASHVHDLSLHLLEMLENSVRAGATVVATGFTVDHARDLLELTVDDDGHGLTVSPEQALDPFYTTKSGKKTGLGLSLFKAEAEAAGGTLTIGSSELGGAQVRVSLQIEPRRPAAAGRRGHLADRHGGHQSVDRIPGQLRGRPGGDAPPPDERRGGRTGADPLCRRAGAHSGGTTRRTRTNTTTAGRLSPAEDAEATGTMGRSTTA